MVQSCVLWLFDPWEASSVPVPMAKNKAGSSPTAGRVPTT